ncbi:MAG TPA: DUF4230 domain-containing protein [Anditalea sp.]|nr:DUF4230 domain-containing protein [Anditalea sp.]
MKAKSLFKSFMTKLLMLLVYAVLANSCKNNDRALVVGKIQNASDLATTEFVIDKIVFGTKTKRLVFFKINEASFMAYSQARVKAGIDLSKIRESNIRIDGNKIHLSLPPIEVINFSYPPSNFVEDSLISNPKIFLNKINIRDQEEFFRLAELDIRENLQHMGIVKTTQIHTQQMFNVLLSSLGYKEIYIDFESDDLIISKVNLLVNPENLLEQ